MTQSPGVVYLELDCPECKAPKGRPCTSAEACARLTLKPEPIGERCPCGRELHHKGRCWHRRGERRPPEVKPPPGKRQAKPAPTCEKCGGPRSHMSAHLCRNCYRGLETRPNMVKRKPPAPPAPPPAPARPSIAERLEKLERTMADLCKRLGLEVPQ